MTGLITTVPLAQAVEASANSSTSEAILFWVFATIAVGAGIAMLLMRNIVHAALMLVLNFFAISALFLGLQSSFLSIVQIIVYAGAIMVLFLFVIMLLGVDRDDADIADAVSLKVGAVVVSLAVVGAVLFAIGGTFTSDASACGAQRTQDAAAAASFDDATCIGLEGALEDNGQGSVGVVGERMFTRYTFAFELAAVLLTVATLGAMVLGRRREVPMDGDEAWDTDVVLPSIDEAEAILAGIGAEAAEEAQGEGPAIERPDIAATATGDQPLDEVDPGVDPDDGAGDDEDGGN